MKFCDNHWESLKDAIEIRSLSHLVSKNEEDAAARIQKELDGKHSLDNYDPLLNAYWMLMQKAVEMGGIYMMSNDNICPLCEVRNNLGLLEDIRWINGCCDSILVFCEENNLVKVQ